MIKLGIGSRFEFSIAFPMNKFCRLMDYVGFNFRERSGVDGRTLWGLIQGCSFVDLVDIIADDAVGGKYDYDKAWDLINALLYIAYKAEKQESDIRWKSFIFENEGEKL